MRKKDAGAVDHTGQWTTFGITMKRVKDNNYQSLCVDRSDEKAWKAEFEGEGAQDAGGPYRETLSNLIAELYTPHLTLLIPTQNNKNQHGFGRDLWTINPSATTPANLEMFRFLGALIALALRAGHVIDVRFPSLIWKQLMGEMVTIENLSNSDEYAVQSLKELQASKEKVKFSFYSNYS